MGRTPGDGGGEGRDGDLRERTGVDARVRPAPARTRRIRIAAVPRGGHAGNQGGKIGTHDVLHRVRPTRRRTGAVRHLRHRRVHGDVPPGVVLASRVVRRHRRHAARGQGVGFAARRPARRQEPLRRRHGPRAYAVLRLTVCVRVRPNAVGDARGVVRRGFGVVRHHPRALDPDLLPRSRVRTSRHRRAGPVGR